MSSWLGGQQFVSWERRAPLGWLTDERQDGGERQGNEGEGEAKWTEENEVKGHIW